MPTDTIEKGLETLIMRHMTGGDGCSIVRVYDSQIREDEPELEEVEG
jgi:hypothetical protein